MRTPLCTWEATSGWTGLILGRLGHSGTSGSFCSYAVSLTDSWASATSSQPALSAPWCHPLPSPTASWVLVPSTCICPAASLWAPLTWWPTSLVWSQFSPRCPLALLLSSAAFSHLPSSRWIPSAFRTWSRKPFLAPPPTRPPTRIKCLLRALQHPFPPNPCPATQRTSLRLTLQTCRVPSPPGSPAPSHPSALRVCQPAVISFLCLPLDGGLPGGGNRVAFTFLS